MDGEKNLRIVAIIPARGSSKSIPRKNIVDVAGKSLIAYTIESALASELLDNIIVSTEDKEIAEISKKYGVRVISRPKKLARDDTPTIDVLKYVINYLKKNEHYVPDLIVILQPTSPLRVTEDIDSAIHKLLSSNFDSVVTVSKVHHPLHWMYEFDKDRLVPFIKSERILRRQDAPELYQLNGSVYVIRKDLIMNEGKIFCENMGGVITPPERSVDIDDYLDLKFVEFLIKNEKNRDRE